MQKVKHRERVQLRRLCCAVTFVAAFYALCAVVSSASGSGPAALRGSVEGALRGDIAEAPACDFLLEQHATSPSALAWGALSRA